MEINVLNLPLLNETATEFSQESDCPLSRVREVVVVAEFLLGQCVIASLADLPRQRRHVSSASDLEDGFFQIEGHGIVEEFQFKTSAIDVAPLARSMVRMAPTGSIPILPCPVAAGTFGPAKMPPGALGKPERYPLKIIPV